LKPALTAEEWAEGYVSRDEWEWSAQWEDLRGKPVLTIEGPGASGGYGVAWVHPEHTVALGALVLRGYFTWDDVDLLRDQVYPGALNASVRAIAALADRIEALLPPRET
jgi:hypothetical protein